MNNKTPTTLLEAIKHFSDYANAHAFMVQIRWPGCEVCCPTCGGTRVRYIQTRRQWECREQHPKRRFSLKTGTIMEDSPLPLEKWMAALWMEVNCKNSISSWEAHRALGVTQKSAWFMLHRVRHALKSGSFAKPLTGIVEADETLIGGAAKNMHRGRHARRAKGPDGGKTTVMGLLQRHTDKAHSVVRTEIIQSRHTEVLHPIIHKHVQPGEIVFTDALSGYRGLEGDYTHRFIDHAERYVNGVVHTNGIENFWSLLKRCIKGTHVSIEPFHLAAYVDSEAFRFNHREVKDADRFMLAAKGVQGKRLTYKALIGASEDHTADGPTA